MSVDYMQWRMRNKYNSIEAAASQLRLLWKLTAIVQWKWAIALQFFYAMGRLVDPSECW